MRPMHPPRGIRIAPILLLAALLLSASGSAGAADNPFDAAQDGVDWITNALCAWNDTTGQALDCSDGQVKTCFGCHVQAETVFGLARSSSRCYTIPTTTCTQPGDEHPLEWIARYIAATQRKPCIQGTYNLNCSAGGWIPQDLNTLDGYPPELGSIGHYPDCGSNAPPASVHPVMQTAHGGLNLAGYTRHVSDTYATNLTALADWLDGRQAGSGQWIPDRNEAPVDQGESFVTGAAVTALNTALPHGNPVQASNWRAAMDQAALWAETATLTTNQDKVFGLVTLLEAGRDASDPAVQARRDALLADQQPDGGWGERGGLGSNAYATGQAVWILLETGLGLNDPVICAGVQWLVDHQDLDGSWPMGTTGVNTDASRPSRFTATMWPVMALGSINPFGANLVLSADSVATCEEVRVIPVEIRHAGDSPCGLFAEPDTYDLSVSNDSGDVVSVDPPSVQLAAGESAVVEVTWQRSGPIGPAGSASATTIRAVSLGSVDAGCPVEAETVFEVRVPDESPPPGLGDSLRVAREGEDLTLRWDPLPRRLGSYELVRMACPTPEECPDRPGPPILDAAAAHRSIPSYEFDARLVGALQRPRPRLEFYKVRAVAECSGAVGPTCDVTCSDPMHCYRGCP